MLEPEWRGLAQDGARKGRSVLRTACDCQCIRWRLRSAGPRVLPDDRPFPAG